MKRYFVTGANGFVGRHLVPKLLKKGNVSVLIQNGDRRGVAPELSGCDLVYGDLLDKLSLSMASDADVVFHLAAVSFVPLCIKDPELAFRVNATGTQNLLEVLRGGSAERFVYISTGHVYGTPNGDKVGESQPIAPNNPYGASKAAAELMVNSYAKTYGLRASILRPFNMYGPHQDADFIIPSIIRQCISSEKIVLGDVRPVRDFLYIDDAADAMIAASEKNGGLGETFNIGSGSGISVGDVARKIATIAGKPDMPIISDRSKYRAAEIMRLVVDNSKILSIGWKPKTSLEDGLLKTIGHYRTVSGFH